VDLEEVVLGILLEDLQLKRHQTFLVQLDMEMLVVEVLMGPEMVQNLVVEEEQEVPEGAPQQEELVGLVDNILLQVLQQQLNQ
jgi:hypothetical protein